MNHAIARESGTTAGLDVLAGHITPEQAGDIWLIHADRSHTLGMIWQHAYDATGAPR